jgi:hypothetical protein
MRITDTVFQDYLNCKLKAFLTLKGESGTPSECTAGFVHHQQDALGRIALCFARLMAVMFEQQLSVN